MFRSNADNINNTLKNLENEETLKIKDNNFWTWYSDVVY